MYIKADVSPLPGERGREAGLAGTARLDRMTGGELLAGSEFRCTVKLKDFIADLTGAVTLSSEGG